MDIKLPIKIHNKFEIEVKDVTTNEIVQRGYAENIVLNNYSIATQVASNNASDFFGASIAFGRGTGTLDPTRTTLFNRIDSITSVLVETVINQAPTPSYTTKKIVLLPNQYVGEKITEVGIGGIDTSETIFTHALIKDSEGNALELDEKTDTQEITIYATVFFQPNFDEGITLFISNGKNALVDGFTGRAAVQLKGLGTNTQPSIFTNTSAASVGVASRFEIKSAGVLEIIGTKRIETDLGNGKIKTITLKPNIPSAHDGNVVMFNMETLAENNSNIWSGWEFKKTPVGVGNGSQAVFNLTWDEAWLEKPKTVYIDNVVQSSGITFNTDNITFDTAPVDGAVITADYWVKYMPKDTNHVVDLNIEILYGEGVPS